jgi:hypothetical protein
MKVNLGRYENAELRELTRLLEIAFNRIRIDDALIVGGGTTIRKHLSAVRAEVEAADYSANPVVDFATFTITVEGAAAGDAVFASPSGDPGDLVWSAYVSAADEVTVAVANVTGSNVTPTTRDWRASVWQY